MNIGSKVTGVPGSAYQYCTIFVTLVHPDGTMNGEIIDHAFDESFIGESVVKFSCTKMQVISTPGGIPELTGANAFVPNVPSLGALTSGLTIEEMVAIGLI